jgi:MarR family transcriptional regulator, organic hydroperoxide resistance regulator
MQAAGCIERIRNPADERQVFVELTERGKSLEDRAACLGPAVFGDIGIPLERLFRVTDEVKALRDALNSKLAGKGR